MSGNVNNIQGYFYMCSETCVPMNDATGSGGDMIPSGVDIEPPCPAKGETEGLITLELIRASARSPARTLARGELGMRSHEVCDQGLGWRFETPSEDPTETSRVSRPTVTVFYGIPASCNWLGSMLTSRSPANFIEAPACFSEFAWEKLPASFSGFVIHPDPPACETIEDKKTPHGQVEYYLRRNTLAPGCLIMLETHEHGRDAPTITLAFSEYATPAITGGVVIWTYGEGANRSYGVNVHGVEAVAHPSDFSEYQVGDWVFVVDKHCCLTDREQEILNLRMQADPEIKGCISPCMSRSAGPDSRLVNERYIILPIRIGECGRYDYAAVYGYEDLGAVFQACMLQATVIEVDDDTADIEIEGQGRVDGVPIRYVREGKTSWLGGGDAFGSDFRVFVLNKSGVEDPTSDDLVVVSICNEIGPPYIVMRYGSSTIEHLAAWSLPRHDCIDELRKNPDLWTDPEVPEYVETPFAYADVSDWYNSLTAGALGLYEPNTDTTFLPDPMWTVIPPRTETCRISGWETGPLVPCSIYHEVEPNYPGHTASSIALDITGSMGTNTIEYREQREIHLGESDVPSQTNDNPEYDRQSLMHWGCHFPIGIPLSIMGASNCSRLAYFNLHGGLFPLTLLGTLKTKWGVEDIGSFCWVYDGTGDFNLSITYYFGEHILYSDSVQETATLLLPWGDESITINMDGTAQITQTPSEAIINIEENRVLLDSCLVGFLNYFFQCFITREERVHRTVNQHWIKDVGFVQNDIEETTTEVIYHVFAYSRIDPKGFEDDHALQMERNPELEACIRNFMEAMDSGEITFNLMNEG